MRKISVDDFGRSAHAEDERVVQAGKVWWRRVRPMFYRPALPFQVLSPSESNVPASSRVGGVQYVVSDPSAANSTMRFLMFHEAQGYSIETLKPRRRQEVRAAAKKYALRLITSVDEFKRQGHGVYVEFHQRTQYGYLANRVAKDAFDRWADILFGTTSALVFGAYAGDRLDAVNISRVVGDTLLYSTFFARNEALAENAPSLVLHAVREAAAAAGNVAQVFAGMPKSGAAQSIDNFYLLRGCVLEVKPANLRLNPVTRGVLNVVMPSIVRRMAGEEAAAG